MFSQNAISLAVCLLLQSSAVQRQNPLGNLASQEIPQYDKAGPYSLNNGLSLAERGQVLSTVRNFLWDHWAAQRPGQLQVTAYTIEGDPTTWTVFVERDKKNHWRVRAKWESIQAALLQRGQKPIRKTGETAYYDVERTDSVSGQAIPKEQKRQPESYKLRLRATNESDNLVW